MQFLNTLKSSPARIVRTDGDTADPALVLARTWRGNLCRVRMTNRGTTPVALSEVVLFDLPHGLPGSTPLYGESFQMLSQLSGGIDRRLTDVHGHVIRELVG